MTEIYVVSAFCKNGRGGNKAGVVLGGEKLERQKKLALANRLGYPETAFLEDSATADYKIEYFTPTEEVPLCGHATIASFALLQSLGVLTKSEYSIETKSGKLAITIARDGLVFMQQRNPIFYDCLDPCILKDCLDTRFILDTLPIQIVSTGLRDILVPIDSPSRLRSLHPNLPGIADISRQKDVIGIHAFSLVNTAEITAECRNFAPLYGIDEESATGTSSCALACYLYKYWKKQEQYAFEQGHTLGAVSKILVRPTAKNGVITHISVGGYGSISDRMEPDALLCQL